MPKKKKTEHKFKENLAPKIAVGAAAVSVAAGVVAAGAALVDEETRDRIGKGATKMMGNLKDVASEFQDSTGYQAVAHQVTKTSRKLNQKAKKAPALKKKLAK